jgi:hypothetical protein
VLTLALYYATSGIINDQHNEASMKSDPRAACGQEPRPSNAQASRCLPFCGLGSEEYVQRKAALCGMLQMKPRSPRTGEQQDALAKP